MKKKRKLSKKKILKAILLLIILIFILFSIYDFYNLFREYKDINNITFDTEKIKNNYDKININHKKEDALWEQKYKEEDKIYDVIKLDYNDSYDGVGKERIRNKKEYFTTFTTIDNHKKIYKEYKQNGITPWMDNPYWGETMEFSGCGITAMAILLSGYGYDITPEDLRSKYYPNLDYSNLSYELKSNYDIDSRGFYFDSVYWSKNRIISHLKTNRPIIVCVWSKKENRWTSKSHYMVLLAATDNMIYISNPNGLLDSGKSSGWYDINELIPYIAKIMYIDSY